MSQQVLVSSVENEPAPKGDPACWSGPFTYEVCCVERSVNCWDTHHTEGRCCLDWSKFWTDRPGCWAEGRTFQACCIEGRDDCWAYDLRFASRCCGGAFTISQLRDTIQSFLAAAGEPPPVLLLLAALSMPATLGVVGVEHGAESHGRRELKAVQAVRVQATLMVTLYHLHLLGDELFGDFTCGPWDDLVRAITYRHTDMFFLLSDSG